MSTPWKNVFLDVQRHVDEMFEELLYRPWAIAGPSRWRPPLDLYETAEAYLVEVDLPGVAPSEVRIVVRERHLTISGRRTGTPPEGARCDRCERPLGTFERSLDLPQAVDPAKARAECQYGSWRIHLPKKYPSAESAREASMRITESPSAVEVILR